MSSSGSRKRRHKSKDDSLNGNQDSEGPKESSLVLKIAEQQTTQAEQHAEQQSDGQLQGAESQTDIGESKTNLTGLLDRLFVSRQSEVTAQSSQDEVTAQSTQDEVTAQSTQDEERCFTVLQSAVSWKHLDLAEVLLQEGADVAELTESGQNSLMIAAADSDVKMLKLLWRYKGDNLDINATDQDGNTALHLCTQNACTEGVSFLITCGADVIAKNKLGQTPLHLTAILGDQELCDVFIKSLTTGEAAEDQQPATVKGILMEDLAGRTPICEALRFQHLVVVKTLMNSCDQEEALDFYVKRIQKLKSLPSGGEKDGDLDIQSIIGSLLLVTKMIPKNHLKELSEADPINCLVQVVRLNVESIRIVSTACLMISELIWKECPEEEEEQAKLKSGVDEVKNADVRDELLKQFLDCRGPHMVMEKLSSHVFTAHDTYLIVSTLLPVMILVRWQAGKTWLEQNSGNLSFFKELLTRKKIFMTQMNLRNQLVHGMQVGNLIKEFLTFVEGIEAKDREQNLVELLKEEERERIKREKKKRKRQKKHSKQAKAETPQVVIVDASTDDESSAPAVSWNRKAYRNASEVVSSASLENALEETTFQQEQQVSKEEQGLAKKFFPSDLADKNSEKESKWVKTATGSEEFPPISAGSDDRVTSDSNDGWVKVEGRKPSGRNTIKPMTTCLVNPNPVKIPELTKLAPMRWADVAKIGCSKDLGARNFTVLLGDVSRSATPDYFKLSSLSKNTESFASVVLHGSESELKRRTDERSSDWTQIARNAFVDNMSSKERDAEQIPPTDASSDSDSEDTSSTTSSECPSGLSSELKNSLSVADDFFGIETSFSKSICKNREFPSFACAFPNPYADSRDNSLFSSPNLRCFDASKRLFLGQTSLVESMSSSDKNHHRNDEKVQEIGGAWNWLDDKTSTLSNDWETDASFRPSEMSYLAACAERKPTFHGREDGNDGQVRRSSSPLFSKADLIYNHMPPELGSCSAGICPLQFNKNWLDIGNGTLDYAVQKKMFFDHKKSLDAWQSDNLLQIVSEGGHWKDQETSVKNLTRKLSNPWSSLLASDTSASTESKHQTSESFMPSFASMSNAVDNNPIVTSMVESVLTPTVTSLSGLNSEKKLPTLCTNNNDIPSPPPGFQIQKSNSLRSFAFDETLSSSISQDVFNKPSESINQDYRLSTSSLTTGHGADVDLRKLERSMTVTSLNSRSPMVGIVGPFTKMTKQSDDSLPQQMSRQQRPPTGSSLGLTSTTQSFSSVVVSSFGANQSSRTSAIQSVLGLPISASQRIPAVTSNAPSWSERVAQSLNPTSANTGLNTTVSPASSLIDFPSTLIGRSQSKMISRLLDSQHTLLKRASDNQLRSLQEFMECYQRQQAEQSLLQQHLLEKHQQECCGLTGAQLSQLYRQHKAHVSQQQLQQKAAPFATQQQNRQNLPRQSQISPPVLFPSDLRDEPEPRVVDKQTFPAFHESSTSDLLSDLFADPLLIERIAINQIRQQFLTQQANCLLRDTALNVLRDSVYGNDLEYYASMYRVKLKDILGGAPRNTDSAGNRCDQDMHNLATSRNSTTSDGRCLSPNRDTGQEKTSRRWRDAINRILETSWTMRRQYGDIVIPSAVAEFTVSHVEFPLVLGLNTDGQEIAVLILDKSQAYIDPCLLDVMCDPDLDHHFILKCKGMSETCTTEYVALELCDYTLSEYMQIVQLSHRQDPLSANRLSWQLLEGIKFVHHHLGMPHGFLKPSWIFVDSEGRLRLGGCGIVTKLNNHIMGPSSMIRNEPVRSACWISSEDLNSDRPQPSMASDIQVAGMLLYFILTGGQHPFGASPLEVEVNLARNSSHMQHISEEANDLVSGMLFPDPSARPTIEHCLKHPFFWSSEKKFRLILIVGSDVLTEMKTGIALTGNGSPTMMEILGVLDICEVSPNWVQAINPAVMKEMRSFRVYKNSLSELTLFIYNCCLHFDKMSAVAKEVLDDPCNTPTSPHPYVTVPLPHHTSTSQHLLYHSAPTSPHPYVTAPPISQHPYVTIPLRHSTSFITAPLPHHTPTSQHLLYHSTPTSQHPYVNAPSTSEHPYLNTPLLHSTSYITAPLPHNTPTSQHPQRQSTPTSTHPYVTAPPLSQHPYLTTPLPHNTSTSQHLLYHSTPTSQHPYATALLRHSTPTSPHPYVTAPPKLQRPYLITPLRHSTPT
ncbi:tankyrase-2 [Biomphalaria pfeifferi]|uniref:Tankyrase-2 n=1 Tax=Biomphalaria pfeifferi TaxID=112525 RepID=A0AAD8BXL0_BIOPF|nr:tankyrase-2 [Biomphalaria pfeifferi]